jgi:uncharacterized membrane protein YgcG
VMALRCALLVAVFLAAADVAVAKGGGHGGAQNSGIHGAVFGTHHPVFADNHTFANNTFAIVRNPSLLYAILDPYALDCIMKNWVRVAKLVVARSISSVRRDEGRVCVCVCGGGGGGWGGGGGAVGEWE